MSDKVWYVPGWYLALGAFLLIYLGWSLRELYDKRGK